MDFPHYELRFGNIILATMERGEAGAVHTATRLKTGRSTLTLSFRTLLRKIFSNDRKCCVLEELGSF